MALYEDYKEVDGGGKYLSERGRMWGYRHSGAGRLLYQARESGAGRCTGAWLSI